MSFKKKSFTGTHVSFLFPFLFSLSLFFAPWENNFVLLEVSFSAVGINGGLRVAGFQGLRFSLDPLCLVLPETSGFSPGTIQRSQPFVRVLVITHCHPQSWGTGSGHRRRLWKTSSDHRNWPYWTEDLGETRVEISLGSLPQKTTAAKLWSPKPRSSGCSCPWRALGGAPGSRTGGRRPGPRGGYAQPQPRLSG